MQDFFINPPNALPDLKPGTLHDFAIRLANLGADPDNVILMDGQKLKGVSAIDVSCDAAGGTRLHLAFCAMPNMHIRAAAENVQITKLGPLAVTISTPHNGNTQVSVLNNSADARGMLPVALLVWLRDPSPEEHREVAPIISVETHCLRMEGVPRRAIPQKHELAGMLYGRYCEAVGGKASNGDLLPAWDEFVQDPTKTKQVQAWLEAADEAMAQLLGGGCSILEQVLPSRPDILRTCTYCGRDRGDGNHDACPHCGK